METETRQLKKSIASLNKLIKEKEQQNLKNEESCSTTDELSDDSSSQSVETKQPQSSKKRKREDDVSANQGDLDEEYTKQPKRKIRRYTEKPSDGYFIHMLGMPLPVINTLIDELKEQLQEDPIKKKFPDADLKLYSHEKIQIVPSEREKVEIRKQYRHDYNMKLKNDEQRLKKIYSTEEIEKRKEYNARPEVQERKKERAKVRRELLQQYRREYPEKYDEMMKERFPKDKTNKTNQ
jgi:hypothetical protein